MPDLAAISEHFPGASAVIAAALRQVLAAAQVSSCDCHTCGMLRAAREAIPHITERAASAEDIGQLGEIISEPGAVAIAVVVEGLAAARDSACGCEICSILRTAAEAMPDITERPD